jgi:serine/threonine protein phosphatase 1
MIQHFEINKKGSDYIMGDLHGCFHLLEEQLIELSFDKKIDRLFSVGDLVDRGPYSERALEWLGYPWFHSVLGNHEQLAMDAAVGFVDQRNYIFNGGEWFLDLPVKLQQEFAIAFSELPLAIEVETPAGLVGIIHGDCPVSTWKDIAIALVGENKESFITQCIWGHERIRNKQTYIIEDILKVYVGHSVVEDELILGNVHFIDTGVVFGKKLTIVKIN